MLLVSHKAVFLKNETAQQCVTMQKRARAFVATIFCITFCIPYAIKKISFYGALFKRSLAWEGGICKT